jgi:hypothetical protein
MLRSMSAVGAADDMQQQPPAEFSETLTFRDGWKPMIMVNKKTSGQRSERDGAGESMTDFLEQMKNMQREVGRKQGRKEGRQIATNSTACFALWLTQCKGI